MKLLRAWGPALALMAFIFFLSSRPTPHVSDTYSVNFLFYKSLHIVEYFILFLCMARGVRFHKKQGREVYLVAFVLTVLYGISDEMHQSFVPARQGNIPRDGIIDAIGAGLAWIFLLHVLPKAPRRLKRWAETLLVP